MGGMGFKIEVRGPARESGKVGPGRDRGQRPSTQEGWRQGPGAQLPGSQPRSQVQYHGPELKGPAREKVAKAHKAKTPTRESDGIVTSGRHGQSVRDGSEP